MHVIKCNVSNCGSRIVMSQIVALAKQLAQSASRRKRVGAIQNDSQLIEVGKFVNYYFT